MVIAGDADGDDDKDCDDDDDGMIVVTMIGVFFIVMIVMVMIQIKQLFDFGFCLIFCVRRLFHWLEAYGLLIPYYIEFHKTPVKLS